MIRGRRPFRSTWSSMFDLTRTYVSVCVSHARYMDGRYCGRMRTVPTANRYDLPFLQIICGRGRNGRIRQTETTYSFILPAN